MSNEFQTQLPPISDIWVYLSGSPLLALVLTLSAYLLGLTLYERSQRNPLANPVLIAVVVVTFSIGIIFVITKQLCSICQATETSETIGCNASA